MTNTHHTKLKGDIGVAYTSFDLARQGFYVFAPMSENCPYDLIVDDGNKLHRIQVKVRKDGAIPRATAYADRTGSHSTKIDPNGFDLFAIVNADYTKIAYCPTTMIGRTIAFDLESFTHKRLVYWWEDYTFEAVHPIPQRVLEQTKKKVVNSRQRSTKIEWPSDAELAELLKTAPASELSLKLGVSDVAIWRRCKQRNIEKPTRGHWTKVAFTPNQELDVH